MNPIRTLTVTDRVRCGWYWLAGIAPPFRTRRMTSAFVTAAAVTFVSTLGAGVAAAEPKWPELSPAPSHDADGERDSAVVIGISDYAFAPDVIGAVANAEDWYTWLVRSHGVPFGQAALLRDAEATKETIVDAVANSARQVGEGGTLWLVFVGHGAPNPNGGGMLLGADVQQTPRSVAARGIAHDEILRILASGRQSNAVVVLDTCFSGRDREGGVLLPNVQPFVPTTLDVGGERTIMLTAGGSDEYAGQLPGARRPAFSYLLLGALQGWADANGDLRITVEEAHSYVSGALAGLVRGRRQTPQLHAATRTAVLVSGVRRPGPDLLALSVGSKSAATASPNEPPPARSTSELVERDTHSLPVRADPLELDQHAFILGVALGGLAGLDGTLGLNVPFAALEAGVSFWETWNVRLAMRPSFLTIPNAPAGTDDDGLFRFLVGLGTDVDFGPIRLGVTGYVRNLSGCRAFEQAVCVDEYDKEDNSLTVEGRLVWDFYQGRNDKNAGGGDLFLELDAEWDPELGVLFGLQLGLNARLPLI